MIPFPPALCWDSFFASSLLGLSERSRARQLGLAFAFGIADCVASMAASSPSIAQTLPPWLRESDTTVIAWTYLTTLVALLAIPHVTRSDCNRGFIWVVPFIFSVDNLLTPQFDTSVLAALSLGVSSVLMSLAGFAVARIIYKTSTRIRTSRERTFEWPS